LPTKRLKTIRRYGISRKEALAINGLETGIPAMSRTANRAVAD
jgi:hypothetical protein